ncbi:MAG TPA: DUF4124 domain-containing protein [Myxococcales bacterium]|nr:DUF4124 domain-containing protein [Myxococcales bacterium]
MLLCVLALAAAPAARAQVYRWVDPDGSIHYSDSPASAPKNAKVEVTTGNDITVEGSGRVSATGGWEEPPKNEPRQPPPPQQAAAQPNDGTDEMTVRQSFRNAKQRISDLQQQIEDQKKLVESAEAGNSSAAMCRGSRDQCFAYAEQQRSNRDEARRRLTRLESDLRTAKSYLDDLERWASSKAIPRAWRE